MRLERRSRLSLEMTDVRPAREHLLVYSTVCRVCRVGEAEGDAVSCVRGSGLRERARTGRA